MQSGFGSNSNWIVPWKQCYWSPFLIKLPYTRVLRIVGLKANSFYLPLGLTWRCSFWMPEWRYRCNHRLSSAHRDHRRDWRNNSRNRPNTEKHSVSTTRDPISIWAAKRLNIEVYSPLHPCSADLALLNLESLPKLKQYFQTCMCSPDEEVKAGFRLPANLPRNRVAKHGRRWQTSLGRDDGCVEQISAHSNAKCLKNVTAFVSSRYLWRFLGTRKKHYCSAPQFFTESVYFALRSIILIHCQE